MGTFTKSFGSCGGYIAGSKDLIEYLKYACPAHLHATSISPPAAEQIISSIKRLFLEKMVPAEVAVVTVAFPATSLLLARAHICISAAHTTEDLVKALEVISEVGDMVGIKYFPAEPKKQQLKGDRVKLE